MCFQRSLASQTLCTGRYRRPTLQRAHTPHLLLSPQQHSFHFESNQCFSTVLKSSHGEAILRFFFDGKELRFVIALYFGTSRAADNHKTLEERVVALAHWESFSSHRKVMYTLHLHRSEGSHSLVLVVLTYLPLLHRFCLLACLVSLSVVRCAHIFGMMFVFVSTGWATRTDFMCFARVRNKYKLSRCSCCRYVLGQSVFHGQSPLIYQPSEDRTLCRTHIFLSVVSVSHFDLHTHMRVAEDSTGVVLSFGAPQKVIHSQQVSSTTPRRA